MTEYGWLKRFAGMAPAKSLQTDLVADEAVAKWDSIAGDFHRTADLLRAADAALEGFVDETGSDEILTDRNYHYALWPSFGGNRAFSRNPTLFTAKPRAPADIPGNTGLDWL